jgi:hypothetical protein
MTMSFADTLFTIRTVREDGDKTRAMLELIAKDVALLATGVAATTEALDAGAPVERLKDTPLVAFWRWANLHMTTLGFPDLSFGEAYDLHKDMAAHMRRFIINRAG